MLWGWLYHGAPPQGKRGGAAATSPLAPRAAQPPPVAGLAPWRSASVAWWLDEARRCYRDIRGRGRQVLVVGGTPLYLRALLQGLFDGPPADAALRQRLTLEAGQHGAAALHARLAAV